MMLMSLPFLVLIASSQAQPSTTPPVAAKRPSVAVMNLSAKGGVEIDYADQLTAVLVAHMRDTRRFERVISANEVETIITFEQQKQLLACEKDSCMAEIAGSLGVDYLVSGTIGKFGNVWLFNVRLLNARTSMAEGTVARTISGGAESLLSAVDGIVLDLLKDSRVPGSRRAAPSATIAPAASPASPSRTSAAAEKAPTPGKPPASPVPMALRAVGIASLAVGVVPLAAGVAALAAVATALIALVVPTLTYVPALSRLRLPLTVAMGGGVLGAFVSVVLIGVAATLGAVGVASSFLVE